MRKIQAHAVPFADLYHLNDIKQKRTQSYTVDCCCSLIIVLRIFCVIVVRKWKRTVGKREKMIFIMRRRII